MYRANYKNGTCLALIDMYLRNFPIYVPTGYNLVS